MTPRDLLSSPAESNLAAVAAERRNYPAIQVRRQPSPGHMFFLFCESDARCAVLQLRILLDRKGHRANESHKGQVSRTRACRMRADTAARTLAVTPPGTSHRASRT